MILFFYNLALVAALVLGAPWWLWRVATTMKYREGLLERLGLLPAGLMQSVRRDGRPVLWIHAVSVGEVLAVSRLVQSLDAALPGYRVLVSTTTRTGQALARERFGRERVFYCPLDLPWAVRAYLRALKPAMLILAETEFWPNLLSGCFRRGIPVAVVNARISDRSWPRYWRLRSLWRRWLSQLAAVLAQSETDAERLEALGCAPERTAVSGNLKFDVRAAEEAEATTLLRDALGEMRLVVAGSTLEGEEERLLAAWAVLERDHAGLALVLAPRHPERFEAVAELLEAGGFAWRKRSSFGDRRLVAGEIVLLDSIGELASVYSLAAVAFVGGSLFAAGGHNPLEPAQFGVPIVMGPSFQNFRAIVQLLLIKDAIRIVKPGEAGAANGAGELAGALREQLIAGVDGKVASGRGERALEVYEEQAGATGRTMAALLAILQQRGKA